MSKNAAVVIRWGSFLGRAIFIEDYVTQGNLFTQDLIVQIPDTWTRLLQKIEGVIYDSLFLFFEFFITLCWRK